ncbi:MAG: hypothetical protein ABI353_21280 [Isosphaeraceae bacterium]
MDDPRGRQAGFNAASRGQWDGFAAHRRRMTALLGEKARPGRSRLCVLGAGNGNDLDLLALLANYREVHVVDLDAKALESAAIGQGVAGHPGLHRHGGVDLTGMIDMLAVWSPLSAISSNDLEALANWPWMRVAQTLPGPFDVTGSTCLLTQLLDTAAHALGDRHPRLPDVLNAVRVGHLRLLDRLTAPGGRVVLVTDVVSSTTLPALGSLPESTLADLLPRLTREGNFISGVDPSTLLADVRRDPVLSSRSGRLGTVPPWRWQLHERIYLVWALRWCIEIQSS